ncbi:MAG: hypothetical protein ACLVKO_04025 [Dysgonomonas sp.]
MQDDGLIVTNRRKGSIVDRDRLIHLIKFS